MKKQKRIWGVLLCATLVISLCQSVGFCAPKVMANEITDGDLPADQVSTKAVVAENATGDVVLEQIKINETGLKVMITDTDTILTAGTADQIKVTARMFYDGKVTQNVSKIFDLNSGQTDYEMDFENFGKFSVETEYLKEGQMVTASDPVTVGIVAETYNLAPISATFPAVLFSLSLWEGTSYCITRDEDGKPIPTIALFERADSWDWEKLPENVYKLPTASESDFVGVTYGGQKWFNAREKMSAYIRDLYEISPGARFNLYSTDNYVDNILVLLTANHIPESQYHVVLLSDGSGTYSYFNSTFANDTDGSLYNSMCSNWSDLKAQAWEEMKYDSVNKGTLPRYAAVAAADDNVDWWVARTSDTFKISNTELLNTVVANCTVMGVSAMLTEVQSAEKDHDFQNLYHFNSGMFDEANKTGKPVMLILGSRVTSEKNFKDYAEMVKEYYGDSYMYYYKGHPATPTELYPQKQADLDELGITDVDSSIPAELILFFFPDIYMCGYSSTTFQSVESSKMACGVFNMTKENGLKQTYGELMDFFASVTNSSNPVYGSLCTEGHTCYLLEFNDIKDFDIGIYDADDKTLTYYKNLSENGYEWSIDVLKNAVISDIPACDYTGEEIKPDIQVEWNGKTLVKDVDYTISYDSNIVPGQGYAVIKGIGDYVDLGSVTKYFVINKIDNPLSVSCQDTAYGDEIEPDVQNPSQGSLIYEYKTQEAADDEYSIIKPVEPGMYTVRVTSDYTDCYKSASATADFTIVKATPEISILPEADAVVEGQALADSVLKGGQADVIGSFSWKDSMVVPSVSDSGKTGYTVLFIPEDQEHYNTVEKEITIIVKIPKPAPTESPVPSATEPPVKPIATESPEKPSASDPAPTEAASLNTGQRINVGKNKYVVKVASKSGDVSMKYAGTVNKKAKKAVIPEKVKYNGKSYKVTEVLAGALAKNKNLTHVTIGASVTQIGKKAFYNCKNLKKVIIKSKKISKIKSKAFKGIHKKAKFSLPGKKKKDYKKKIKKSGFNVK